MKIATINTRGFTSKFKQDFLLRYIKQHKLDIVAIQKVNSPVIVSNVPVYDIATNAPQGLGTALFYKRNQPPKKIIKSPEGRIIHAEFEHFTIVNIYGFANALAEVKRNFYQTVLPAYLRPFDENLILLGDFNATLTIPNNKSNNKAFSDLVNGIHLFNTSALMPLTNNACTFRSKAGQSFIDHILVDNKLSDTVSSFTILPYAASDHELVYIDIDLNTAKTKTQRKKSAYWKFNVSLLDDPGFKNHFTEFYDSCRKRKFLYNSISDWWEQDFKRNFKHITIDYTKEKKDDSNKRIYFKEKCLQELADKLNVGEGNLADYIEKGDGGFEQGKT